MCWWGQAPDRPANPRSIVAVRHSGNIRGLKSHDTIVFICAKCNKDVVKLLSAE
jgi:hypothetical protein